MDANEKEARFLESLTGEAKQIAIESVSENDEFVSKTRNFVSKTRNCVLKTRDCVLKLMNFAGW